MYVKRGGVGGMEGKMNSRSLEIKIRKKEEKRKLATKVKDSRSANPVKVLR